ncbi:MAG: 3-oxoacyl-ACP synthase [Nitrospirae bacterium RIFCSPLOWO2_02_FULL_62_14]|nr:MAG: 3-oxoacyl-ACP synthase [Nitrospirae bacterium RIFCSPLOWO2_02_FULL_62_14]OGW69925.1 MAG: 3-oxoacyl-ACP synthase [Nitrospirae bacterium RIFCSPLOWO2_01_FULL_62_17]OGX11153.1 MAG: 3-oxoacyl-ACP synthase [Nitrospirae bacterium RIFCSPLOWO2_12_FULL_63_8]
MRAGIAGTGSYVPERVLTNADLERMVETSDEWIVERTGIRERRLAAPGEACSDLGTRAAERALQAAGIAASDLDMILVATCTGDAPLPSTACLIQHRLGATKASACDIGAACCGFVYALAVGDAYIKTGLHHVLVIGSEVMSAITNWKDRNTCVLFGDGAGAVVLSATKEDRGILSSHLHSDGSLWNLICVPGGGSRIPPTDKMLADELQYIKMKGNETFKVAVKTLEESAHEALKANGMTVADLDVYVPHQANARILKAVASRLELPMEKVVMNLDRYGNTSAASIPIALDEAVRSGRIKQGHLVMMTAFGSGLTWATSLVRW